MNKISQKIFLPLIIVIICLFAGTGLVWADNSYLRFAQVSDVHFDSKAKKSKNFNRNGRLLAYSGELLKDAIDQINNTENIDFVIFTGDQINSPRESELRKFLEIINTLKCPWYLIAGNHDIAVGNPDTGTSLKASRPAKLPFSFSLPLRNKLKYFQVADSYNKNFKAGKDYYSFSPKKGFLVIVMDGVINSYITANGYFDKKQLNWLEEQLNSNKNSKVIIAQHFPLVEPQKSITHRVLNADKYLETLKKYDNIIAILSGHYHKSKITKVGNVTHISAPALVQYPNAFRILTITDKNGVVEINTELKTTRLEELKR